MGPMKAALESSVRYIAAELADRKIPAHAVSARPVKTRAASGIDRFDELLDEVRSHTPADQLVTIEEIGRVAAFLASSAGTPLFGSVIAPTHWSFGQLCSLRYAPSPRVFHVENLPVTDDWSEDVPVTEAEIDVFERYLATCLTGCSAAPAWKEKT